jgi:hypothetical protein
MIERETLPSAGKTVRQGKFLDYDLRAVRSVTDAEARQMAAVSPAATGNAALSEPADIAEESSISSPGK